ncbi:helix-turn-helix transcriptional regulator [Flavobacterium piscinae]|uniref:AraC family transcriptional regulator n=1 Tax=Flavobacterium piscinae TaxID=2506424 RepID=UPI00198D06D5|nr:AraC family transcriptional regulator [Flavobacterium piscinae]MBC8883355.1 helix-turn-helix transcriptional regulator [Flavobacterium piscinae]
MHDQSLIFEQFSKLNYKKQEVQEEVFRNLLQSKYYIDAHYLDPIGLEELIQVACISKYAYIRLFKHTFSVTPYQYILQKRLQTAKERLLGGEKNSCCCDSNGVCGYPYFQ